MTKVNKQSKSPKSDVVFLHCLFSHPSTLTAYIVAVADAKRGFSVRNCVVFLAGTVRLAGVDFPCGGRVKPASTPVTQQRCSTWQQDVDSLHTSPHFSLFLSHCFQRQGKSASKINPLSKNNFSLQLHCIMNDAFPLRDTEMHSGRMTFLFTRNPCEHLFPSTWLPFCEKRKKKKKSGHLVTMSWNSWRKYQYPGRERGMIFSESPCWEQRGKSQGPKCHYGLKLWGAAH